MTLIADDLAFLRHHAVTALGAGVKELFAFVLVGLPFHHFSEIQKGRQRDDLDGLLGFIFFHGNQPNMGLSPPQQRFGDAVYA